MHARLLRLLAACLCLTAVSTGCIVNNNGHEHEPEPGDVSFLWTFVSPGSLPGRCADVPDVKRVRISIPGQTLDNGGVYSCNTEGVDGIILRALAPGLYNYAIEALGQTDQVLYSGSGSFTVDGNEQVSVTLLPASSPPPSPPAPGDITFLWSFAGSGSTARRCAEVPEVKSVRLAITGETVDLGNSYPCNSAGVDGITLKSFAPGTYSYTLEAVGQSGQSLYTASGSIVVDGNEQVSVTLQPTSDPPPPPPAPGDITFLWSFSGSTSGRCADVLDVKSVRITIPGEVLPNDGLFPCNTFGVDGIVLHDFRPGAYNYTVEALGYSGQVLHKGSGSVTVNGNVRVNITLTPNSSSSSYAYVSWSFPANSTSQNPNCTQAGVASVDVRIDGGEWTRLDCSQGMSDPGVRTPSLVPGRHTLELIGLGSGGQPSYYAKGQLDTQSGSPVSVSYRLWAVGGMALRWALFDGTVTRTCSQAGVTGVSIHLRDEATGEFVHGNVGDSQPCEGAPVIYRYLKPGSYRVFIYGTGSGGIYTNENDSPLTLTVTAFQQKTGTEAVTVVLKR
jgi:hypothetical protein